jgi:hypothetical protein
MNRLWFIVAAAFCGLIAACSSNAQLAQSDFSIDSDGWQTADNGGAETLFFGDYITQKDKAPEDMAFIAPQSFLGDKSSAYRGHLTFEILSSQFPFVPSRPSVQLTGNTSMGLMTLAIDITAPVRSSFFFECDVLLSESKPWIVVGEDRAPTATEFKELLGQLTELRITCDSAMAEDDYFGLDSVRLDAAHVRVFFLAGQSNMSGCNDVRNIDPSWQVPTNRHMFYWDDQNPNPGFVSLSPGSSTASCSNVAPEFFYGPELGFGNVLESLYPDDQILVVKYAVGGTTLYVDWTTPTGEFPNGGPMWNQLLTTIDDVFLELGTHNYPYSIEAFVWMQGESDADRNYQGNAYNSKLTNFIAGVRSELGEPELPFIIARIRDAGQPHVDKVRLAQQVVADADPWACWFDTDDINFLPDGIHYDDLGMIELGTRFADRLYVFLDPRGDVNRDGRADINDLHDWTQNPVDLNCDGLADHADMDIVVNAIRTDGEQ